MHSRNHTHGQTMFVYCVSFVLGLFLYFNCDDCYKGWWIALEQYSTLSRHIYEPTSAYYAESLLVPFLAKLFNANPTREAFNALSGFLTLAILPLLAAGLLARLHKLSSVIAILCIYAGSFLYLRSFWLGYPDPLTIILLNCAALSIRPVRVFFCVLLAGLAHFSLTAASTISLMALYFAASSIPGSVRPRLIAAGGLGLVVGKLLLKLWYYVFSYKLEDRIDFVAQGSMAGLFKGIWHFYEVYTREVAAFWATPGWLFIAVVLLLLVFFALKRRLLFCLAFLAAIAIAYAVRFITTDGLRDFATTVSAAYVLALCEFFQAWQPRHGAAQWLPPPIAPDHGTPAMPGQATRTLPCSMP